MVYIHNYPENEMIVTTSNIHETEISNVGELEKILENLEFIVIYTQTDKFLTLKLNDMYYLQLEFNSGVYYLVIYKVDGNDITIEEEKKINELVKEIM